MLHNIGTGAIETNTEEIFVCIFIPRNFVHEQQPRLLRKKKAKKIKYVYIQGVSAICCTT